MVLDFSKCPYDISLPGLLLEHYPDLLQYHQFNDPDDDKLLRLAIAITEELSPFVQKEREFTSIVTSACAYLKITNTEFISDLIQGTPNFDVDKVFSMQAMYFRMLNKWEYNSWYDHMYQYHENSMVLRTPLNSADDKYEAKSKTKQEIRKHQKELTKDLIAYEGQIFLANTNIKKVLTKHAAVITNWPEKLAKDKPEFD